MITFSFYGYVVARKNGFGRRFHGCVLYVYADFARYVYIGIVLYYKL